MHLPLLFLQPVPCPPAYTLLQVGTGDTGTQPAAEKGPSGAVSRYLQQPEGAEALKGQRRDALQGVVAEDPAEGKEEVTAPWALLHAPPSRPTCQLQLKLQLHPRGVGRPWCPQQPLSPGSPRNTTAGTALTGW